MREVRAGDGEPPLAAASQPGSQLASIYMQIPSVWAGGGGGGAASGCLGHSSCQPGNKHTAGSQSGQSSEREQQSECRRRRRCCCCCCCDRSPDAPRECASRANTLEWLAGAGVPSGPTRRAPLSGAGPASRSKQVSVARPRPSAPRDANQVGLPAGSSSSRFVPSRGDHRRADRATSQGSSFAPVAGARGGSRAMAALTRMGRPCPSSSRESFMWTRHASSRPMAPKVSIKTSAARICIHKASRQPAPPAPVRASRACKPICRHRTVLSPIGRPARFDYSTQRAIHARMSVC
jgi:hypothetical protein